MIAADDRNLARLRRIADALRVPVETLFHATEPRRLSDMGECVRLFDRLRTDAGRAAALDALRKVLDEEGD